MISSLQLELGQIQDQLSILKESSGQAPTTEQLANLTTERDNLKSQLTTTQESLKKTQSELQSLRESHTALEKDTKTTHETLIALRQDHGKLKESHASEIQKSRLSHSKAAELQLENKTLVSRVEELKQKVVALTSEKLELVERSESLGKEVYKLRKSNMASGGIGGVELNTELDTLIQGQETRQAIRETNQRTYSQFVGELSGETLKEINQRRLKDGKDSGEFGREKEIGFVVDLISSGGGGCGMCTGEILVL
jgi:chromosome segregation ATPase